MDKWETVASQAKEILFSHFPSSVCLNLFVFVTLCCCLYLFSIQVIFCVSDPLFICLYVLLVGWMHVSRGQEVLVKRVTLPKQTVAEAIFFSVHLAHPSSFFPCFYTCLSLYLCPDLWEMRTETHVSVGCFRSRVGPARQVTEEIPQAHMEQQNLAWMLSGDS